MNEDTLIKVIKGDNPGLYDKMVNDMIKGTQSRKMEFIVETHDRYAKKFLIDDISTIIWYDMFHKTYSYEIYKYGFTDDFERYKTVKETLDRIKEVNKEKGMTSKDIKTAMKNWVDGKKSREEKENKK